MAVFVNRMLNLKKVKVIGFDMDYTLVGYHTKELEKITHKLVIDTLIKEKGYPEEIRKLKFNFNRSIVGLVIDKRKGNLLKLSRYSKVKLSYHGLKEIGYPAQNRLYQEMAIDIKNSEPSPCLLITDMSPESFVISSLHKISPRPVPL